MQSHDPKKRRLPASEDATFTTSRFRIIIPHPGEPEPEPEVHDIPRCVAKYEGPLSKCNKICTRMRKVTSIANDFEKERLGLKVRTLTKEHTIVINKHKSELQPFQKSLQEYRGYQTALCQKRMKNSVSGSPRGSLESLNRSRELQLSSRSLPDMHRSNNDFRATPMAAPMTPTIPFGGGLRREQTCMTDDLPPYGRYEGVAIRELRDDIKRLVEENHPRARRIRQAHKLMESNMKKSPLAHPELLHKKLNDIVSRPWAEFKLIPKNKPKHEAFSDPSKITGAKGVAGPAMVEQSHKGYGNFYTSTTQAFVFN